MALDETAENSTFIETLPRLGYRFIAPGERVDEHAAPGSKARMRIGVLPIEELGTPVEDYFALGLKDLISAFSAFESGIRQAASRGRAHLQSTSAIAASLEQIQRDLSLEYLLRGWVRRSTNAIRICVQLHDLHDKSVLCSETYDRSVSDLHALQEEVTRRVSQSLAFELLPSSFIGARKYARSPAAYDLYLKGRYFWHKMTSHGMLSALHLG